MFLYFPRRSFWQWAKHDGFGGLEMRDTVAAPRDNFASRDAIRARLQSNKRAWGLAPDRIWFPDDRSFHDLRMPVEAFLNLSRSDVLAARNDDVF
jgi:hypothetical protein